MRVYQTLRFWLTLCLIVTAAGVRDRASASKTGRYTGGKDLVLLETRFE